MDRKISFFYFERFSHVNHFEAPLDRGNLFRVMLLEYLVDGVVTRNYKGSVQ